MNLHSTFTRRPDRCWRALGGCDRGAGDRLDRWYGRCVKRLASSLGHDRAQGGRRRRARCPTTTLPGSAGSMISSSARRARSPTPRRTTRSAWPHRARSWPRARAARTPRPTAPIRRHRSRRPLTRPWPMPTLRLSRRDIDGCAAAGHLLGQHLDQHSYAYATPDCVVTPPVAGTASGATASAGSAPASPPVICNKVNDATPTSAQLVVTLIVAYKYA